MTTIKQLLTNTFTHAIDELYHITDCDPIIQPATRVEFGDYQANFAMSLAKRVNQKPQLIAHTVVEKLQTDPLFESLSVAGPGFINITLASAALTRLLDEQHRSSTFGLSRDNLLENPLEKRQKVIVDYSSANAAKEMHVGHLRSAIIGDAIVRILRFLGHDVVRQNHIGDWGTQFGMLIEQMMTSNDNPPVKQTISDLNTLYKDSKQRFDHEPGFAEKARQRTVLLQQGDIKTRQIWQHIIDASEQYFAIIYERLGILLTRQDSCGESFYNDVLDDTVAELEQKQLISVSEGAKVIFLEGFVDKDQHPLPLIVRKSDGAALYATTDLAAIRYRINTLQGKRLIYVTDARQKQHFAMIFAAARKAGWADESIVLEHVPFGSILGEDHKPFKTRSGETIKLVDLLDEAEQRALTIVNNKQSALEDNEKKAIAKSIGIGALKYGDLSNDKVRDYVFNWDNMLSFDGNTAPYLQNAYVRIRAIFRKGLINPAQLSFKTLRLSEPWPEPCEHQLAVKLLAFPDILQSISEDLALHRLCHYLYDLAALFHHFYEVCPILNAPDETIKNSRLLLSDCTARVLKTGLELLGITALELM